MPKFKQLPFSWKYDLAPASLFLLLFCIQFGWPGKNQHLDPAELEELLRPGMTKSEVEQAIGVSLYDCYSYTRRNEEFCSISDRAPFRFIIAPQHSIYACFEDGLLRSVGVSTKSDLSDCHYEFSTGPWADN